MPAEPDETETRALARVGEVLGGRYRLDEVLGVGAMGTVFRAYHTGLERSVALKLLHQDLMSSDEMRARFSREAAAISKLDHPNCVRVTDFGSDATCQYLVMELLEGTPLSEELGRPLPPLRAIELIDEVLAGLEHAHGHGLVHRDIKPDNIFMVREGGGRTRPKVLDFGIVKLQEQPGQRQLTQVGMIFGTPHFMSPEQAMGSDVDARTDLYAIGIVLYTMLAGRQPFESDDPVKVLRQQINDSPPPLPAAVPAPLRRVVTRLLAKKPEERYPSATVLREALAVVLRGLAPTPVPAPAPTRSDAPMATIVPSTVDEGASEAPSWWPPSAAVRWAGAGVGLVALLVALAVAGGDDAEPAAEPDAATAPRADGSRSEGDPPGAREGTRPAPTEASGSSPEGAADGAGAVEDEERALQASLASIDALMDARKFDAARITLGPLLEAYEGEAGLHWRMAKVLTALGGADNRAAALESYAATISADATFLDDEAFMAGLMDLVDDPKLRDAAVRMAIETLGTRADDKLLQWLNVQSKPLAHAERRRIIEHLGGHDLGEQINRPLQRALDLWQAPEAEDPCAVFGGALADIAAHPDSFLVGTLRAVEVPRVADTSDAVPQACPDLEQALSDARARHDRMFVGIEPVVPKAYRRRAGRRARG